ncbi:hypothetical protein CPB84DRAFT_1788684 [Gymnopilus junonius]|uniref:MYND-type domain-containing protein n=1 Tax=Gymnopilus junonius TaxID=109634 RepID=A0A9P5NH86_GYMJU|nr:hypothetical protein CPB84DRAFT_1788684 [Gymnopilus junonius]
MLSSDISRDDLLILLASMGVVLPESSKLPVEGLNKRLGQTLDTSQDYSNQIDTPVVDPWTFPLWPEGKSLYEATQRGNITEAFTGVMSQPKQGGLSSKEDTFKEMRQSVLTMAYAHDEGIREIYYRDKDMRWALYVRILDVYELKNGTPLFFLVYRLEKEMHFDSGCAHSKMSDLERRMILRLFRQNRKRLDPKQLEDPKKKELEKIGLYQSFVLPLCPIGMKSLGKLTDPGCEVCGKKTGSRCLQCLSVLYCGKECQRADWPTHKQACKSLKGGKWHKITLSHFAAGLPFQTLMNRLDSGNGVSLRGDGPPEDVHNGKMFLAKFQLPLSSGSTIPQRMLVYDRQRSFSLNWERNSDPVLFDEAARIIGGDLKFYRWMKRTGDYTFEICIDRSPIPYPVW